MMALTHGAIALAGTSLILSTANPMALGLAILGSQLPDLDSTNSTIGKIFFPVSSWIEDRFPHRSITHSLLATAAIAALSLPIGYGVLVATVQKLTLRLKALLHKSFTPGVPNQKSAKDASPHSSTTQVNENGSALTY